MIGQGRCLCPTGFIPVHTPPPAGGGFSGGCGLYHRRDVPLTVIPLQSPLQAVAGRIHLHKTYTVCSIYLPPNDDIPLQDLEDLIRQLPRPFFLLGDMNGRHFLWGDSTRNRRGDSLVTLIDGNNLNILNTGEPTHFHSQTGTLTAIDLSLCSPQVALDFSWEVADSLRGSDHYPILLKAVSSPPSRCLPKWCLSRADWEGFQKACVFEHHIDDFPTIDEAVDYFVSRIHFAASLSIPRTSGSFSRRPVPWWTQDCTAARSHSRRAETQYISRPTSVDLKISFHRLRARYRRVMKEARHSSWRAYISTICASTPVSKVWQRVRKMKGKFIPSSPPVLSINGDPVADPLTVAEEFASHFVSVAQTDLASPSARDRLRQEQRGIDFSSRGGESYNVLFTPRELCQAMKVCADTSPGQDDVPYAMLCHLRDEALDFLLSIYNRIWIEGTFPSSWGVAVVIPIPKPGKDHSLPTNFRPISLTSCVCKLFEKMVNSRLVWFLERENFFSRSQCGFRKHHSTTEALISLESSICGAFASRQHHVTIFFDLEKAYDTAWRHGILQSLYEFGLRGRLPVFLQSFLANRVLRVRVGNILSSEHPLPGGIPQGSVLSVALFAVAINGIVDVLPEGIVSTLYVDDLSISFAASRMSVAERRLQLAIDKVCEWTTNRGFRFSPTKTVAVHFCRTRGIHPDPDLHLYGKRIPCREETRFLGLIFDNRLTWVPHLRALKTDCLRTMDLLKVLSHTSWGADRATLLYLHRSLILSKLEYGCEVYSSATPTRLRMLDSVHHAGVRLATGAFRSSPIPSLLVDAGVLPLDLQRQSLLLRCWYRLQRLPDSIACRAVSCDSGSQLYHGRRSLPKPLGFRLTAIMETLSFPALRICPHRPTTVGPWLLPEVSFCKSLPLSKGSLPPQAERAQFLDHFCTHQSSVPVFTDGSKSDEGVGYGVVFPSFNKGVSLPSVSSVFTAEISAILYALMIIFTLPDVSFTIFSDSCSALQSLCNFNSPHPLVNAILEWLYLLKRRGRTVSFCWVPAHVGVAGNEEADALAKAAARRPALSHFAVPATDLRSAIHRSVHNSWQERWITIGQNKLRTIRQSIEDWSYCGLSRRWETALARLRIGHTLYTHGFLMEGGHPPYCDDCLVPLTVRHLLVECPSLGDLRVQFLSRCRGSDGAYRLSLALGERCFSPGHEVHTFIEKAGLLNKL